MSIKLSICIPTYNRCEYLRATLASIVEQATDEVEIVVSDNASTDDTSEMIEELQKTFTNLLYVRQDVNRGADANYMSVVEHANGEYCWLFGSDDVMRDGVVHDVLRILDARPAVILANRMECDIDLRPVQVRHWLAVSGASAEYEFPDDEALVRYFDSVRSLGGVFSYLSSIVVRRDMWGEIEMDKQFMGTAYSHVYKILSILLKGGVLFYHNDWTVYCRMGNDSFSEGGYLRRVMLDVDGYMLLGSVLLANRPRAERALLGILQRQEGHLSSLARIAAAARREGTWDSVKAKLLSTGIDVGLISRAERVAKSWWGRIYLSTMESLRANRTLKGAIVKMKMSLIRLGGLRHV